MTSENEVIAGPVRRRNLAAEMVGSIHDDKTASALGSRGGGGAMTESPDWHTGASPWGGPIVPSVVELLFGRLLAETKDRMGPHVGLFGAIEIRFHRGPVLIDREYTVTGEVVALSQTPKTEVLWFDSRALDSDGSLLAEMRMMSRQMKLFSPLYQDQGAAR